MQLNLINIYGKKEWGSTVILSDHNTNSRGVAILLPKNYEFNIDCIKIGNNGRKIILNITEEEHSNCLVNIYAPTQDKENEQILFFTELNNDIEDNLDKKLIIGGDFNICLQALDN